MEVASGAEAACDVVYVADGGEVRAPWERVGEVALERGRPVRSFPSYRGQRNYPGLYWSATTGGHVGFESWVERDHLTALDFDPRVVGIASQPFWLVWTSPGGGERRHAPDFFARLADGAGWVVDSRPWERIRERDAEAFAVTGRACGRIGWRYDVWDQVEPVRAANLRWLAGYRHPRHHRVEVAAALREVFASPVSLMAGAERAGDPLEVLPVLFHLMWRHELVADLSLVLGARTLVRRRPGGGGDG